MLRSQIVRGLMVACLVTAVVLGAAVGFGIHRGAPLHPFRVSGAMLLGAERAPAEQGGAAAVTAGLLSLAFASALWGILFVFVAHGLRGWKLALAAALFTVGVFAVSTAFFPHLLHFDSGRTLPPAEDALVYALIGAALALGTRVAFTEA